MRARVSEGRSGSYVLKPLRSPSFLASIVVRAWRKATKYGCSSASMVAGVVGGVVGVRESLLVGRAMRRGKTRVRLKLVWPCLCARVTWPNNTDVTCEQ